MGLHLKFSLYRILVYSGFGLDMILVYSGFGLYRILVYSGFGLDTIPCILLYCLPLLLNVYQRHCMCCCDRLYCRILLYNFLLSIYVSMWFSPGTLVYFTNKTETLWKVTLNTVNQPNHQLPLICKFSFWFFYNMYYVQFQWKGFLPSLTSSPRPSGGFPTQSPIVHLLAVHILVPVNNIKN